MDFTIPAKLAELQESTRVFIRDKIIPLEADARQTSRRPEDGFWRELNALASEAGLLAPHVATEYGGLGLGHFGRALVFEEAGYSVLGPLAMNLSALDKGNMHLMQIVERIFREVRAFRIYDGPSEVHRWSLAQKLVKHGANR